MPKLLLVLFVFNNLHYSLAFSGPSCLYFGVNEAASERVITSRGRLVRSSELDVQRGAPWR